MPCGAIPVVASGVGGRLVDWPGVGAGAGPMPLVPGTFGGMLVD
jgi:hypothetical protein